MRKAKKSVRVEVIALSLFIAALAGYATFFTVGSSVQAQVEGNAGCGSKWAQHYGEAQKEFPPEKGGNDAMWKQKADEKNGAEACKDDQGSTGQCDKGTDKPTPNKTICRGDKDKNGNPASDAGKKKAEDAMKDKGDGKGGGGEPPKMPEMPKKEPKQDQPKQGCQLGQTTDQNGQPCPKENAPANFLSQMKDKLLKAFTDAFNPETTNNDLSQMTPEQQLQKISDLINGNPTLDSKPERIEATNNLANAYEKAGFQGTPENIVAHANQMSIPEIDQAADNTNSLRDLAQSQSADLQPTVTGSNPESSSNIIPTVYNWLTSWFGF
ncbi:hypothetical protein HY413_00970 [Candidatus Kaiserbacteria bacterium]|nr:hypothetical protein [Candidatus Kaiserbacteria bacterium]